jgi:hypothetical protein
MGVVFFAATCCGGVPLDIAMILILSAVFVVDVIIATAGGGGANALVMLAWVVGCASCLFCVLLMFLLHRCRARIEVPFAIALFLVWLTGAAALTFSWGPFRTAGNGYFATWLSLYFALHHARTVALRLYSVQAEAWARRSMVLLCVIVGGLVELIEAGVQVANGNGSNNALGVWALLCGIASTALMVALLVILKRPDACRCCNASAAALGIAVALFCLWAAALVSLTFSTVDAPAFTFVAAPNAFCATWFAFLGSLALLIEGLATACGCASCLCCPAAPPRPQSSTFTELLCVLLGASVCETLAAGIVVAGGGAGVGAGAGAGVVVGASADGLQAWALACGLVSTALCAVLVFLTHTPCCACDVAPAHPWVSGFLALWWLAGVVTTTIWAPFAAVGNGFVASWLCLVLSSLYAQRSIAEVRWCKGKLDASLARTAGAGAAAGLGMAALLLGSAMLLVQGAATLSCSGGSSAAPPLWQAWAVVAAVVSLVLAVTLILLQCSCPARAGLPRLVIVAFLAAWWVAAAAVLVYDTASSLYAVPCNGYFSVWIAAGGTLLLLLFALSGHCACACACCR